MHRITSGNEFPVRALLCTCFIEQRKPDEWDAQRTAVLELEPDMVRVEFDVEYARAQLGHSVYQSAHAISSAIALDFAARSRPSAAVRARRHPRTARD